MTKKYFYLIIELGIVTWEKGMTVEKCLNAMFAVIGVTTLVLSMLAVGYLIDDLILRAGHFVFVESIGWENQFAVYDFLDVLGLSWIGLLTLQLFRKADDPIHQTFRYHPK